ncbi:MAG: RDD family protein [Oligoflexia bacterium]|nr:RDD family protein [Oligoflexia bacterium]
MNEVDNEVDLLNLVTFCVLNGEKNMSTPKSSAPHITDLTLTPFPSLCSATDPNKKLFLFYPSTWKRFFALMVDMFILSLPSMIIFHSFDLYQNTTATQTIVMKWSYIVPYWIGTFLYFQVFLKYLGATPGKLLFKLKVVEYKSPEKPLSWKGATIRSLAYVILSSLLLGMVPQTLALFRRDRRQLADLLAGTIVVQAVPRTSAPKPRWFIGITIMIIALISAALSLFFQTSSITPEGLVLNDKMSLLKKLQK